MNPNSKFLALICLMVVGLVTNAGAYEAKKIEKGQRELLVVQSLSKHCKPGLEWLYKIIDASSISISKRLMGHHYKRMILLTGNDATKEKVLKAMKQITAQKEIQSLDLFLNLHGTDEGLMFDDSFLANKSLKEDLEALPHREKWRLLYSTSCWGSAHAKVFHAAGFQAALGSQGINANASYEYPALLKSWHEGKDLKFMVDEANSPSMLAMHDRIASLAGFSGANSRKDFFGQHKITIDVVAVKNSTQF